MGLPPFASRPMTRRPRMSTVARGALSSFLRPTLARISCTMGNIIIKVAAEERGMLMMYIAMRIIATVHHGLLRASLLVMNQTAMRRATPLLVRHPASMKVNIRNTTVLLPNVA